MNAITLITLDLDNTLWDVDSIIVKAEETLVNWLREEIPDSLSHYRRETLTEIREQVLVRHPEYRHDLSFMRTEVMFEVMLRTGLKPPEARVYAQRAFDVFFEGRNRVVFFPGALDMLHELSRRFDLIALTNGNANIVKAGLSEFMRGAYSPADVGQKKPHPAMFNAPLEELSLRPSQAIHVGDHLVDDIQGANDVGMHSVWVNLTNQSRGSNDAQPTREVNNLEAVIGAVEAIYSA